MRAPRISFRDQIVPPKRDCLAEKRNCALVFVVCGPSGAGKSTLLKHLLKAKDLKKKVIKSISLTTRPKRQGEREGRDYFFISERDFQRKNKAKKLLEWTKYLGYYYATPKDFISKQLKKGLPVILCLDLKGARRIKQLYPKKAVTIFIEPPSLEDLKKRIKQRGGYLSQREFKRRVGLAKQELLAARKVPRRYDYYLMNKDLIQATKALKALILKLIDSGDR